MKFQTAALTLALTAAGVVIATSAVASVDRSAPPGGVYRLKPGFYVAKNTACSDAPNAAIRRYDGVGISDARTRACRAKVVSRRGGTFVVEQSCVNAGTGPAPRVVERQIVSVRDALTFSLGSAARQTTYRYCPIYMLPKSVR